MNETGESEGTDWPKDEGIFGEKPPEELESPEDFELLNENVPEDYMEKFGESTGNKNEETLKSGG